MRLRWLKFLKREECVCVNWSISFIFDLISYIETCYRWKLWIKVKYHYLFYLILSYDHFSYNLSIMHGICTYIYLWKNQFREENISFVKSIWSSYITFSIVKLKCLFNVNISVSIEFNVVIICLRNFARKAF